MIKPDCCTKSYLKKRDVNNDNNNNKNNNKWKLKTIIAKE